MNAERLITENKKEEGTAKYSKYAKNPNPSPQSGFGFAYFAYFAVQEIAWAGILVAPWRLGAFALKCLLIRVYPRPSVVHSIFTPIYCIVAETPKLRPIKVNQGQSRLIKVNQGQSRSIKVN